MPIKGKSIIVMILAITAGLILTAVILDARSQCPVSSAGCPALEQSCYEGEFLSYWPKSSYCACRHLCATVYRVYCWDYDDEASYVRYGTCQHFVHNYCQWLGGF